MLTSLKNRKPPSETSAKVYLKEETIKIYEFPMLVVIRCCDST